MGLNRTFDGKRLDVSSLAAIMTPGSHLSVNTIRKSDLKRLKGLDDLPLSSITLRWLSARDLTVIPLPSSLTELRVWHSNKLVSLAGIDTAPDLERVELRGNGPLEDATALRNLPKLKHLSITGGPPSLQKIVSLDFLRGLSLRSLELAAVDGATLDLGPVASLVTLEKLDLHGPNFAPQELAKVASAHAWFYDDLMNLPDYPLAGMGCKTCGGTQKELFLRGKKGLWCSECNRDRLEKVLREFRDLVENAKT